LLIVNGGLRAVWWGGGVAYDICAGRVATACAGRKMADFGGLRGDAGRRDCRHMVDNMVLFIQTLGAAIGIIYEMHYSIIELILGRHIPAGMVDHDLSSVFSYSY